MITQTTKNLSCQMLALKNCSMALPNSPLTHQTKICWTLLFHIIQYCGLFINQTNKSDGRFRRSMTTSIPHVSLTLVVVLIHICLSSASDTINAAQSIRYNQTLVSAGGIYELGFFSPGRSGNWYLGIWFKNVPDLTVVWVANRAASLRDSSSAVLKLIHPAALVLVNGSNHTHTLWSSNSNTTSSTVSGNPVAQLLDSGNLVLATDEQPWNYLWQSFDHPTDTLLPGITLGLNSVRLSSWKTLEDPAPGDYIDFFDQTGYPQVFIKQAGIDKHRMGPWNGVTFSGTPRVSGAPFTFNVHKTADGVFYLKDDLVDNSVITRAYINTDGVMQRWLWVQEAQNWVLQFEFPKDLCDSYNACGVYGKCTAGSFHRCACLDKFVPKDQKGWDQGDWSTNGCVRRSPLNCSAGDGFVKYPNLKIPDSRNSWYNESMTLEECKLHCLRNCSCTGYTRLNISEGGSGCLLWYGDMSDIRDMSEEGQDLYIRMASSELGDNGNGRRKLIVSLSIVGAVLVGLIVVLCIRKRKKNRIRRRSEFHSEDLELPLFSMSTIAKATDGFSFQNKLGEGGYGPVYKGTLEDGQDIAVKRLSAFSMQGLNEFKNEVIVIAQLQHRNLVKLLGCCIEGEEKMLIYEYMPNKSLDTILFDKENRMHLHWPTWLNIVNGIARGLMYLHQDSRLRVIHRDLKPSNILLDGDLEPKISDFGIAKIYRGNETEDMTKQVVGTYGYMSPEYAVNGRYSVKSDVFSFGVIVLEIVSRKRNNSYSHGVRHLNLLGHAWTLHREGRSIEVVDAHWNKFDSSQELLRLIQVGLLCVQQHPNDRPSMTEAVTMLSNDSVLPQPNQPGYFTENTMSSNGSTNWEGSRNEMTVTMLGGR